MDLLSFLYFYTLCLCCWYWKGSIHGALYWRDNDESMSLFEITKSLRSHQSCLGKHRKIGKVWVISKRTRVSFTPFGVSRGFTKLICATVDIHCYLMCLVDKFSVLTMSIIYNNDMNSWCYYIHMYMMFISYHVQYTLSTIIVKFKQPSRPHTQFFFWKWIPPQCPQSNSSWWIIIGFDG